MNFLALPFMKRQSLGWYMELENLKKTCTKFFSIFSNHAALNESWGKFDNRGYFISLASWIFS